MTENAPFHADLADGPAGGRAYWLRTPDGVRLRAGYWPGGSKGLVLLLPGRTEYVEKYGRSAAELLRRGYGTLTIDWRGQGLADRLARDPMLGHVDSFADYQADLAALLALARALEPDAALFLLSHSMGGCIALRALQGIFPVQAAVFSAPMWGINMAPAVRPFAATLARLARHTRQSLRYIPGTGPATYVATAPYLGNVLTRDADMFGLMKTQITRHPELALGGPSMGWLHEALQECAALARLPAPDTPTICALGTAEKVVDPAPVHSRMAQWPKGRLDLYDDAEHEVIMEIPRHRNRFFDSCAALFDAHR